MVIEPREQTIAVLDGEVANNAVEEDGADDRRPVRVGLVKDEVGVDVLNIDTKVSRKRSP